MKKLEYISTRDENKKVTASKAIVSGLSDDGGLFIPESFENIKFNLDELYSLPYRELTKSILKPFLDDFSEEQISLSVDEAYKDKFDIEELVNIIPINNSYLLELWHGPTSAFKDMALTLLPHLLTASSKNINENNEIVILTATSGDTGKAALEGFKDVDNTKIIVFYPKDGVSYAQEKQMVTTEGSNTSVISVVGNFDDTQNAVKEIFNDQEFNNYLFENGFKLSSANSINIGRLLPQIVYYYYSYFNLVNNGVIKLGEPVNFVVPSGNFGDILAGYYAKLTGLPVNKLVCASNKNNILTDFFTTGEYNIDREFFKTTSPSMDILISSNLERLLYDKLKDSKAVEALMKDLKENNFFKLNPELFKEFLAEYATEDEVFNKIKEVYKSNNVLIDPHTSVGVVVKDKLEKELGEIPTIILSTANPYKFPKTVYESITGNESSENELDLQEKLEAITGIKRPEPLKDLKNKKVNHSKNVTKEDMKNSIAEILIEEK